MKATIENKPIGEQSFINRVLYVIRISKTRQDLQERMHSIFSLCYDSDSFIYGFGGSHMWVSNKEGGQRIIFVEL
jgi:hypothetical protein